MAKMLMIYPDRCTGCHNCELACSFFHDGEFSLSASRIHVHTWEMEGISVPTTCEQCEDAPCVPVCPTAAMHTDPLLNRVAWDEARCIGCRMCALACPFGAVAYETSRRRIVKCDLCDGTPECAAFCPVSAIEYLDETGATRARQRLVAAELKKTYAEAR
jgi:carbon-monoxide dehydrogenase iron sulfur subunit